jgi:hypothetical protein
MITVPTYHAVGFRCTRFKSKPFLISRREENQMTIGELRDELDDWPESFEIIFGCPELEFNKLTKRHGDKLQLEFKQTIYKDAKTGKWHVDE